MAFVANRNQDEFLNAQKDEEKQDEAIRTSTAGDIGAESTASTVSGQSVRPSDQARQPQRAASQVLTRNQGKAANPFQFDQTRQALTGAKGKIQTEKDQYMSNAVAPYQTGQQLTGQVQQYAREGGATPEWLQKYQQGTPQALGAFASKTNTNFAPVNAMQTNAGVRAYLRNPADPESRSGEQAIDFSLLNADPNFNIQREGVLRDYGDLLKFRQGVEAETPAAARAAQQAAFDQYKANISGTLEGEAKAIQDAARAAEAAYDAQFANLPALRAQIAREEAAKIAAQSPENLRSFIKPIEDDTLSAFFNPLDAASTNPEDFITEDQAGDFNRIMGILGKGGSMPVKGRLAGATAPGRESLRFDEQAYRNLLLNNASLGYERDQKRIAQEREAAEAARRAEANKPAPPPERPATIAQPGQLAIDPGEVAYASPLLAQLPQDQYVDPFLGQAGIGQLAIGLSHGGRVPGKAMVPGDSEINDVVDIKASPGEIVIPRSAAQDKESAKEFIDNMPFGKTRDLLKNKYACGGKVRDNYACGGMVKGYAEGGFVEQQIEADYDKAYNSPLPGVKEAKQQFDDYLTENVVEPIAKRGYPDLGAALATMPSTVVDAFVPSTTGDVLMGAAPFPKTLRSLKRFDENGKPFENVGISEFTAREAPKVPDEMMQKVAGKSYNEAAMDPVNQVFSELMQEMQKQGVQFSPEEADALKQYISMRLARNARHDFEHNAAREVAKRSYKGDVPTRHEYEPDEYMPSHISDYWNLVMPNMMEVGNNELRVQRLLNEAFKNDVTIINNRNPRFEKANEFIANKVPYGRNNATDDEAELLQAKMYRKK